MSKGLILVKLIKAIRTIKYFVVFSFNQREISFDPPPRNEIRKIGHLDKNRKIHVEKEFNKYFFKDSLFNEGSNIQLKPGNISLVWDGDQVLLLKHFSGLKRFFNFYNEITVYKKLCDIDNIPKIKYVDYSNFDIYFEFNKGLCLTRKNSNIIQKKYHKDEIESIKSNIDKTVSKIHSKGVFIYDLERDNILINGVKVHFIDFADSIYKGIIPSKLFNKLKEYDHIKRNKIYSFIDVK